MKKAGLVGVGNVAVNGHLPGWIAREGVHVVAATDAREDRRPLIQQTVPGVHWYPSFEEMVSSENLDFVDVCTPPSTHSMIVRSALEKGLHVLCEKPLVIRAEDVQPLAALARTRDRALVTVHNWKNAPPLAKITELVKQGAVGDVRRVEWQTLRTRPAVTVESGGGNWRIDPALAGGGILVDHGWHALYVVLGWLPERPRRVSTVLETRKYHDAPLEDTATIRLETGKGAGAGAAEIFLTWTSDERANRARIEGTRGTLNLDGGSVFLFEASSARYSPSIPSGEWNLPSIAEGSHHPEWFEGVMNEFLGEVEDPARRGRNLHEAALCAALIHLSKKSSERNGEWLDVEGLA
jgi:predicted dehydrogenase